MNPVESFSDVIRFAQRMLAEMREFCARGAPKFRKFCNSFVKFLRGFRVISTADAHFSDLNNLPTPLRAAATLQDLCSACWPSARIFICERHAEIPEVLQFFREIFAQILRDLDARRALFRI